jgi:hypothetical protein
VGVTAAIAVAVAAGFVLLRRNRRLPGPPPAGSDGPHRGMGALRRGRPVA